ncbi:MAG TPA: YdiU family protein [Steroidobacteraceae bacterium]|nr:YdiU family protein [Steroidobacteraceae bacterium]
MSTPPAVAPQSGRRLGLVPGYGRLPERFYARVAPVPVARPRLIAFNGALATELGLDVDGVDDEALAALFSGNERAGEGETFAVAYAGHQFGQFVPSLGDGRAILIGDASDGDGLMREIQLKGSGRTPFSRGGDGRAALGPVLREYLVSEAMHALGVPTTRALAAVATGETVWRDGPLPGAILTRVARSHVRVGTFEYFAARADRDALELLVEHVIRRQFPEALDEPRPALALLSATVERQASLVAQWMLVGFVHGVMNTDNTSVGGETIDYGPCAFLDVYDPATVFSSIDHGGRYAYANQPHAARWNLARLAETLMPLIDPAAERSLELANAALAEFPRQFEARWLEGMRRKLGLAGERAGDAELVRSWLDALYRNRVDYTLGFRGLAAEAEGAAPGAARALFAEPAEFDHWAQSWRARLAQDSAMPPGARSAAMRRANPAIIPRNHLIEHAIAAAVADADLSAFTGLSIALARPFDEPRGRTAEYARAPSPAERVTRTFCGT